MLATYAYKEIENILGANPYYNYMEIGSFDGEGIAMLCKKYPKQQFYSIDPFIEDGHTTQLTKLSRGESISFVESQFYANTCECKNLIHYKITTQKFIELNIENLPKIDVLFIDGDHEFNSVVIDLLFAKLLAKSNNLIVYMDDVNKDGVNLAINLFKKINYLEIKATNSQDLIKFEIKNVNIDFIYI